MLHASRNGHAFLITTSQWTCSMLWETSIGQNHTPKCVNMCALFLMSYLNSVNSQTNKTFYLNILLFTKFQREFIPNQQFIHNSGEQAPISRGVSLYLHLTLHSTRSCTPVIRVWITKDEVINGLTATTPPTTGGTY